MFKENFIRLCNQAHVSPTSVCKGIGLSSAAFSQWTDSTVPRGATLQKIADYFDVPVNALLSDSVRLCPIVSDSVQLSPDELQLIKAYRAHPEFHDTIRKLLDIPGDGTEQLA